MNHGFLYFHRVFFFLLAFITCLRRRLRMDQLGTIRIKRWGPAPQNLQLPDQRQDAGCRLSSSDCDIWYTCFRKIITKCKLFQASCKIPASSNLPAVIYPTYPQNIYQFLNSWQLPHIWLEWPLGILLGEQQYKRKKNMINFFIVLLSWSISKALSLCSTLFSLQNFHVCAYFI